MTILGILFKKKRVTVGGRQIPATGITLSGITIDATVSQSHKRKAEVTKNPVEDGAKITDHVQLDPVELELSGVFSDDDLNGLPFIGNVENLANAVSQVFGGESRSIQAHKAMIDLWKTREPFEVVTKLELYKNMVVSDYSVDETATTGNAIHFRAKFEQITIVKPKSSISAVKAGVKNLASKAKKLGTKVSEKLTDANSLSSSTTGQTSTPKPSTLFNLYHKFK